MSFRSIATFNLKISLVVPERLRAARTAATPQPIITQTAHLYWQFTRTYRRIVAVALTIMPLVILVQNGLLPLVYSKVLDRLSQVHGHISNWVPWLVIFVCLHLVVFTGQRITSYVTSLLEHRVIKDAEQHIFATLLAHSADFHTRHHGGSLVAQAKRFTGAFSSLVNAVYTTIYALLIRIVIAFGFLLYIAPSIAIVLLSWTAVYVGSILWLTRHKMHASEAAAAADSVMTAQLADAIGNAAVIKMFGNEAREQQSYRNLSLNKFAKRRYDWRLSEIIFASQSLLMIALETVVLALSIHLANAGMFSVGKIALVQFFLAPIMASLWQIATVIRQVESGLSDASEMTRTLLVRHDIRDVADPALPILRRGEIEFQNVTFRYPGTQLDSPLLDRFNLHIAAGEKIGLVGPSGSGKSSLTKLLLRFMDVQDGQITLDGQNIAHLKQTVLRQHIAYVPQEPHLFHRTIRENICYGRPEATETEMIGAAKQARAHDFITRLPEGYDTLVGERGSKLSGGERQRIAIARALLKDAPIVILDEATSALDSESEKLIQEAFETLVHNRTAIVIAHRLSTVRNMDRILVLNQGRVIEDGTHRKLLAFGGVYCDLWRHQIGAAKPSSAPLSVATS